MTAPLILVEGLGLATRSGAVFADLTFAVPRGTLSVVVGPSGSGRSSLLLAVCGRMRGLTGTVRLGRHTLTTRPQQLREVTAIARLATLVEPEGQLTVGESMLERALIDGVQAADADAAFAHAEQVTGVVFDRDALVDQLPAYERSLLCVVLAMVKPSELIVFDDADRSLDLIAQRQLMAALTLLCRTGRTILTSTTEAAAVPADAHVIALTPTIPDPTTSTDEKTS